MAAPVIWLPGIAAGRDTLALFSQYLGMTALIGMALSQVIATRWPGVEAIFGPLDESYRLHKWLGLWALAASFLHDTIDADMRGLGRETALVDAAETAGEISLYGLLILVAITVATFIPYHLWKWTHRFIGVFFVLSAFHYLFILKPFANGDPLGLYMGGICLLGLLAYAYTSAPRSWRPSRAYRVDTLERQGEALVVNMSSEGRALRHRAGQFVFISFPEIGMSEPHPFTLSGPPREDGRLRISIAPLGDYTSLLMSRLEAGTPARVEGPFGDFAIARGPQVWVAAGIGITPFAAMAGALKPADGPVTVIHTVRDPAKAAHVAEMTDHAATLPNLDFIPWHSRAQGRIDADTIADIAGGLTGKTVLYCGPSSLRDALKKDLRKHGVSARRFRYELFEIRTGIGMNWLLARLTRQVPVRRRAPAE
ncbi:ferredoxin reductase family protein [Pseudaestuariivita atlantica]|uniref:ferredoxin reductase family protein n=1 Tax=Pseudaestuariivita atlantica TaxID=1317121 RepID=UPI00067D344C|nr:ferric reductase-like transmembrane domain-containing protein [Pseudaestuariivita atlantica]